MKKCFISVFTIIMLNISLFSQNSFDSLYIKTIYDRVDKILRNLHITDTLKYKRIREIVANQYFKLNEIQSYRDSKIKEISENYSNNKVLRDSLIENVKIFTKAQQYDLHAAFIAELSTELKCEEIDKIKDGMTYNVMNNTYNVYLQMLPGLSEEQKKFIKKNLYEAREMAMDAGKSEEKHSIFGKYKGRINNYLSSCGYDMKIVEREFVKKSKSGKVIPQETMEKIFNIVKTPYKYGMVLIPDSGKMFDCPTVFRKGSKWYMSFIVFDGRGYETWLAESKNLLNWKIKGRIMSFSDTSEWDCNQKAGYVALRDINWGGAYKLKKYNGKYWMSYFGGKTKGYERGILSIGLAYTNNNPSKPHEWKRLDRPILSPLDTNVRWWENSTMYKNFIFYDEAKKTGYPFVMFYNARGDSLKPHRGAERIGMAVSNDLIHWIRFNQDPVINHHKGICGDPEIHKIDSIYVMFYFGAFWPGRPNAFNRFACSTDLVNWTEWNGEDLIKPSEDYDSKFAHKSSVIFYKGVVYHFYCAVDNNNKRGIAVATSKNLKVKN